MLETIPPALFKQKIETEERIIIDVRTRIEYQHGHIQNAIHLDFYDPFFEHELQKLDKTKQHALYCRSGYRSGEALELMHALGFIDVVDLYGGTLSWARAGYTLETGK